MMAAASPPKPIDWGWSSKPTVTNNSSVPSSNHNININLAQQNQNHSDACNLTPSPPITELQFLPPAAGAPLPNPSSTKIQNIMTIAGGHGHESSLSASFARPPQTWNLDPSRLKQLMMGSITTNSYPSSNGYAHQDLVPHGRDNSGASPSFFDIPGSTDTNKPLPSGWERCLDLKSGSIYIKKCDATSNARRLNKKSQYTHHHSLKDRNRVRRESASQMNNGLKQDWSQGWYQGNTTFRHEHNNDGRMSFFESDREMARSPDRESLSLDLDLRLTNEKRTRVLSESMPTNSRSLKYGVCSPQRNYNGVYSPQSTIQEWKWRKLENSVISTNKPTSNIQEMVCGSTMTTAICSRCLMYVLMKKSNPTCPRCSNPVILDCNSNGGANVVSLLSPISKKRPPSLDLSPDDLSLSTDSSR